MLLLRRVEMGVCALVPGGHGCCCPLHYVACRLFVLHDSGCMHACLRRLLVRQGSSAGFSPLHIIVCCMLLPWVVRTVAVLLQPRGAALLLLQRS
mgnify:FL=1